MGAFDDIDEQLNRPPEPSYAPLASTAPPLVVPRGGAFDDIDRTEPQTRITVTPRAQPDKYQQAAIEERDRLVKAGVPMNEGYTDRLARGAGFGWADEISAGFQVPLEMIRRGVNPVGAYG